jgi:hypothetical protein
MQNANPAPAPATPAQPAKKKGRGCLVVLAVFGGGALLVVVVALGVAAHFGWLSKLGRGAKLVYQGSSAPGAKELRALGCDQVMVLNADDLGQLVGKTGPHSEKVVVTCVGRGSSVPTCDDAAAEYVRAVGKPDGPFIVTVRKTDGKADHCTERYADDGTRAN